MYQINLCDQKDIRAITIPNMNNPVSVEFDNTGVVYWSDVDDQTIYKADIFSAKPIQPVAIRVIQRPGMFENHRTCDDMTF